jgi:hypothetical protein
MSLDKGKLFKDALKPGMILGLILILIQVITYALDLLTISLFASMFISFINFGLVFLLLILLVKNYRQNVLNNEMTYGSAFFFSLSISAYAAALLGVYYLLFNGFVDPDYMKNVKEAMLNLTEQFMYDAGLPEDAIEQGMLKASEQELPSLGLGSLYQFMGMLVQGGIVSLITSAIVKKTSPNFVVIDEE